MRGKELLRLVWLNITQNKFKVIMTSIGIIVGAATIVMVIAIGKGGQADVADQFKNLNAGAIDISYDGGTDRNDRGSSSGDSSSIAVGGFPSAGMSGGFSGGGFSGGGMSGGSDGGFSGGNMPGGNFGGGSSDRGSGNGGSSDSGNSGSGMPSDGGFSGGEMPDMSSMGERPSMDDMPDMSEMQDMFGSMGGFGGDMSSLFGGGVDMSERINQENITLSTDDLDDLLLFAGGITEGTISYTTRSSVDGGDLDAATTYTIAGVKENYATISNLTLAVGEFITESNDENKEKVCVLGASVAEEIFGSAIEAYGSIIYIDDRQYVVNGVLQTMGTVSSGISPDEAVFIPYETGVKYIVGTDVNPTITVIADDVNNIDSVIENVTNVLAESYPNAEFTYEDAGSKMEAASASNEILTMLLIAMAVIVFVVGGIGIMNVLFVSVKERTNEIGILKAIGCSQKDILMEFLLEAAAISLIGGILGVGASFVVAPIAEYLGVRVEMSVAALILALVFSIGTGTIFGFYPAYKASKLVPVEALGAE